MSFRFMVMPLSDPCPHLAVGGPARVPPSVPLDEDIAAGLAEAKAGAAASPRAPSKPAPLAVQAALDRQHRFRAAAVVSKALPGGVAAPPLLVSAGPLLVKPPPAVKASAKAGRAVSAPPLATIVEDDQATLMGVRRSMGSSASSDGVPGSPDPAPAASVPADAMVQRILEHPFGEPPEAGTHSGDADRSWFLFRLTVASGWYMAGFMVALMEASCQFQLAPQLGEEPDSRCRCRVPVFKPGELLYVAFVGLKRFSEPHTL